MRDLHVVGRRAGEEHQQLLGLEVLRPKWHRVTEEGLTTAPWEGPGPQRTGRAATVRDSPVPP